MAAGLFQLVPPEIFEMAVTAGLIVGGLLLIGAMISLGVFAYRSVKGEGMPDPQAQSETADGDDEEDGLRKGDADEEWDYY